MSFQPGKATNDPNAYFAFAKQSAKGTEGTTFHFLKHLDGSGFEVEKEIQREREGGDGQEVGLTYTSLARGDGQMNAAARSQFEGRVWFGVLGQDTVASAQVASLARHSAFPAASLPYHTIEQRFADEIERVVDGVFTGLSFEGEAGRPWKTSVTFISGGTVYQRDTASALTPTREQGKPFFYPFGSYVFDAGASYGCDVTKIKVEVTRNVDDGIQTCGINRDDVVPLNFDLTVDATLKYTSRDFYQKVTYNSGSQIQHQLPTGSIDLTMHQNVQVASGVTASGVHRIQLPLIEWTDGRVNKLEPDGQTMFLDLVGMTVKGSTHAIIVTTDTNDVTAYSA